MQTVDYQIWDDVVAREAGLELVGTIIGGHGCVYEYQSGLQPGTRWVINEL